MYIEDILISRWLGICLQIIEETGMCVCTIIGYAVTEHLYSKQNFFVRVSKFDQS